MSKKYNSLLCAAAAALLTALPSPRAAAQMTVWVGNQAVYRQATGTPDSMVFSFTMPEAKASQECDPSTVGGKIAKASEAVDLGLSVKWAPWNVGATSAAEAGAYFAWGEVQAKEYYSWSTYWWMAEGQSNWQYVNKYQIADNQGENYDVEWYDSTGEFIGDSVSTLLPADDAATVNWGGKWRMPTQAELDELSSECTWEWKAENEYAEGSLAGYLVTGPNDNSIFLPAAGYRWYSDLGSLGSLGYYWSSELDSGRSSSARYLFFFSDYRYANDTHDYRDYGFSVRAVLSAAE